MTSIVRFPKASRRGVVMTGAAVVLTVAGLHGPRPATAQVAGAPLQVNSTADAVDAHPGDGVCATAPGNRICTLRAAIQEANARGGPQTIRLPAGVYTLALPNAAGVLTEDRAATGDLDITAGPLTIIGAGSGRTVVEAIPTPAQGFADNRVFEVLPGAAARLVALTVGGGHTRATGQGATDANGAGIQNAGLRQQDHCWCTRPTASTSVGSA